jgi:pyruvate/2-oxoglutarate dehydrogenase complex dihydrolipoamide acyltransferase (E2) component
MAEIVRRTENELKWSAFPRFSVEIMLLKLVHLDETVSIESLLAAVGKVGQTNAAFDKKKNELSLPVIPVPAQAGKKPAPLHDAVAKTPPPEQHGSAPEEAAPAAPAQDSGGTARSAPAHADWPHFVEHIQKNRPHLGYHLSVASMVSMSHNAIDLRFPKEFHFQFSEVIKKKNRDEIQKELNDFFQCAMDLHITLEARDNTPAEQTPVATAPKPFVSIDDEIAHEPIIQNVLDIFDGTVL